MEATATTMIRSRSSADDLLLKANLPQRCPQCGSHRAAPLYWVDVDVWDCADCAAIWSERD